MHRVVLAVELKRLVDRGAVNGRLQMARDAEAVLEADDGALIQAEQIAGLSLKLPRCRLPLNRWVI